MTTNLENKKAADMMSEMLEWFLGADVAYSYLERGNTSGHQRPEN